MKPSPRLALLVYGQPSAKAQIGTGQAFSVIPSPLFSMPVLKSIPESHLLFWASLAHSRLLSNQQAMDGRQSARHK